MPARLPDVGAVCFLECLALSVFLSGASAL